MLDNAELIKLLVMALGNHNYPIAMLLLSNVCNPKQILNFANLSEAFIYTQDFCLFLVSHKIVDAREMLREATNRHAAATVTLVLNYVEEIAVRVSHASFLFDAYKTIVDSAVLTCDLYLFRMFLPKLLIEQKQQLDFDAVVCSSRNMSPLTIEHMFTQQYHQSVLNKLRSSSFDSNVIDSAFTKDAALAKGFDWDLYFNQSFSGVGVDAK